MTLYEELVDLLAEDQGLGSRSQDLAAWLKSLQPSVKQLRASYRLDVVQQGYDTETIRLAYVLLYFSHYAKLLPAGLKHLRRRNFAVPESPSKLLSFGTGPGSEVAGWMLDLAQTPSPGPFACVVNDKEDDGWAAIRTTILRKVATQHLPGRVPELHTRRMDFSQPLDAVTLELAAQHDVLLFQNCLNEIPPQSQDVFLRNVDAIIEALQPGALLLFLDVSGYGVIRALMQDITLRMAAKPALRVLQPEDLPRISNDPLPPCIAQSFLDGTDGLIPRGPCKVRIAGCMKLASGGRRPSAAEVLQSLQSSGGVQEAPSAT